MKEYFVKAKKLEFGDNRVEELLDSFGLKRKCIRTSADEGAIIYETERQEGLTVGQLKQIESNSLIDGICVVY